MNKMKDLKNNERVILFYKSKFSDELISTNGTLDSHNDKSMHFFPSPYLQLLKEFGIAEHDEPVGWIELPKENINEMTELNSPKEMIFQLIHEYGGEKRKEMFDYITTLENSDDQSPLTEETLKELGFVQKENRDWTNGKTVLGIWEGEVVVNIAISPTFTTVGKLKMLLEALKGDE